MLMMINHKKKNFDIEIRPEDIPIPIVPKKFLWMLVSKSDQMDKIPVKKNMKYKYLYLYCKVLLFIKSVLLSVCIYFKLLPSVMKGAGNPGWLSRKYLVYT